MHLIRIGDAPIVKEDLEKRRYYLPDRDPLEVIETQMGAHASQGAHSHNIVREAMLVLEGTIGVEEMVADVTTAQTLNAGDFVVFDRGVAHRMENRSDQTARTLHFKFLGEGKDRALFAEDKVISGNSVSPPAVVPEIYTQDYRHFDNLIWQVPAWASAIFSLAITTSALVLANAKLIEAAFSFPVSTPRSVAFFLFGVFFVLLCLTNVFLRFRLHQRVAPRPNRRHVPALWYMGSGQTSLLLVLFIEMGLILCFALIALGLEPVVADAIVVVLFLPAFLYVERSVRNLSAELREDRKHTLPMTPNPSLNADRPYVE